MPLTLQLRSSRDHVVLADPARGAGGPSERRILASCRLTLHLTRLLALQNRVRSGSFGLRQAAALVLEVLSQLAQLHRNGIAQGHVTPENSASCCLCMASLVLASR